MRRFTLTIAGLMLAGATPAFAQDATTGPTAPPPEFKLTGTATLISDYRFRGLTQTDGDAAIQGTLVVTAKQGFYVGTFVSNIDGSGKTPLLTGYGSAEIDLYGGFTKTFKGVGVDAGLLYYYYPGGASGQKTDYFEPYASVSYTLGPVAAKVGGNYAWNQSALKFAPGIDSDLYLYGEASVAIPKTPVTLKGHLGHTQGALGLANLDPNKDSYFDWSVNAEAVGGPIKVGVTYLDTDITEQGGYARRYGRGSSVLGYVALGF